MNDNKHVITIGGVQSMGTQCAACLNITHFHLQTCLLHFLQFGSYILLRFKSLEQ
jgi:hypothetical protein